MIVPGATAQERAIRLAGALAELGITQLVLVRPDGTREQLHARRTDLPAILSSAQSGTLEAPALRITLGSLSWESTDPALADRLRAAVAV